MSFCKLGYLGLSPQERRTRARYGYGLEKNSTPGAYVFDGEKRRKRRKRRKSYPPREVGGKGVQEFAC